MVFGALILPPDKVCSNKTSDEKHVGFPSTFHLALLFPLAGGNADGNCKKMESGVNGENSGSGSGNSGELKKEIDIKLENGIEVKKENDTKLESGIEVKKELEIKSENDNEVAKDDSSNSLLPAADGLITEKMRKEEEKLHEKTIREEEEEKRKAMMV